MTLGAATEGVTRVSLPPGCHPTPLSDLVSPLILCKFAHNFFPSGVTPLEGVTRGGPPPPRPSDATDDDDDDDDVLQSLSASQLVGQQVR